MPFRDAGRLAPCWPAIGCGRRHPSAAGFRLAVGSGGHGDPADGAQLAGRASLITCGPLPARHGPTRPFTDMENALEQRETAP